MIPDMIPEVGACVCRSVSWSFGLSVGTLLYGCLSGLFYLSVAFLNMVYLFFCDRIISVADYNLTLMGVVVVIVVVYFFHNRIS